ncbi:MAG: molybdate ABC transporter permease subunit [Shimia sp.]
MPPLLEPLTSAELAAVGLSLRAALWAVAVGLPLALAVAWVLVRTTWPGRGVLDVIVHLPLVLPPVVTGYLLLLLLGRGGWLGLGLAFTPTAVAIAAGVMAFPLMVRALRVALEAVDPGLEDAARTLGAPPGGVLLHVTLPLIRPGVLSAAVLGFAKALGEFGATITVAAAIPGLTQTIPTAIYGLLQVPGEEGAVLRLVLLSVALSIGALGLSEWLTRRAR